MSLGKIGQAIATRAQAFGVNVIAYDPFLPAAVAAKFGVELVSKPDLLARSDYILMQAPMTPDTHHFLSDAEFAGLCRALNLDELQADPMFQTLTSRQRNRQAYSDSLKEALLKTKSMTVDAFLAKLDAEQVPAASVKRLEDLHNDPQLIANEVFRERDHPVAGKLREARPAARFLNAALVPASAAPSIGEHTEAILRELGMLEALEAKPSPKTED